MVVARPVWDLHSAPHAYAGEVASSFNDIVRYRSTLPWCLYAFFHCMAPVSIVGFATMVCSFISSLYQNLQETAGPRHLPLLPAAERLHRPTAASV